MPEKSNKQQVKRKKPEEIVAVLADKHGVSTRYINMVISGERNNEEIFNDYLTYKEEHNLLIKAIKELVLI